MVSACGSLIHATAVTASTTVAVECSTPFPVENIVTSMTHLGTAVTNASISNEATIITFGPVLCSVVVSGDHIRALARFNGFVTGCGLWLGYRRGIKRIMEVTDGRAVIIR